MSDLVAFLIARLDEDEAAANEVHLARKCGCIDHDGEFSADPVYCSCEGPALVLREVEAKRKILDIHDMRHDPCDAHDASLRSIPCDTLFALASVYSDHPDYWAAAGYFRHYYS